LRLTAEQFTAEFLGALDRRVLPGFRHKYRSIDVLMVDDIQFLIGKKATLDELLYTIDTLHERGRQVVLTCDRSPGDLKSASDELVARISGGLAIPLSPPDYATRVGLVRQFASRLQIAGVGGFDEEIVAIIATQVAGSARQLQGAINRLVVTSQAHGQPVTASLARATTTEFVQQNTPAVRLADIQRAVCQVFGVEASSLKSQRKSRSVAEPRMLAMWLARKYTRAALGEIGEYFGRRSHSTVISAQRKIEGLVSKGGEINVADRACHVEEAIRQVEQALRTA
jgi:chromosomal replication initiator protein